MDKDDNVIDMATRVKQMKNLRPYRDKTEEELKRIILERDAKKASTPVIKGKKGQDDYDKRFNDKLESLQSEYGLDMNDSNDVESLRSLVRYQIQQENVNRDIDAIQRRGQDAELDIEDYRSLKNLGDFQVGISRTIKDLEDKLGISRKLRKEKGQDDVGIFLSDLLKRGKKDFDNKTVKVECPTCLIELGRFWLNFPHLENEIQLSLQCWKCNEKVEYAR